MQNGALPDGRPPAVAGAELTAARAPIAIKADNNL
jgi:hypothetical protein